LSGALYVTRYVNLPRGLALPPDDGPANGDSAQARRVHRRHEYLAPGAPGRWP